MYCNFFKSAGFALSIVIYSHSLWALEIDDHIRFYHAPKKAMVTGKVTHFQADENGQRQYYAMLDDSRGNAQETVQIPAGQMDILDSPQVYGFIPKEIGLLPALDSEEVPEKIPLTLPRSLSLESYRLAPKYATSVMSTILASLQEENQFWSRYQRVLFLAEGSDSTWEGSSEHFPFARALQRTYPAMHVIQTDLDKKTVFSRSGKLLQGPVDHTALFSKSFLKNSEKVNAVIMFRGLCHCRCMNYDAGFACGGLNTTRSSVLVKFLTQALELVNWTEPGSFVYLQGHHHSFPIKGENPHQFRDRLNLQSQALSHWIKAASKVSEAYGVDFYISYSKGSEFDGIVFY
jgi:hypothetical protein